MFLKRDCGIGGTLILMLSLALAVATCVYKVSQVILVLEQVSFPSGSPYSNHRRYRHYWTYC
jgi:hypothetical protein